MITIRKLTKDNWHEALNLSLHPAQNEHIQPPTYFIAKAYIMPDGLCVVPFTIYLEEKLIGFFSLEFNKSIYWIEGLRIAKTFQDKGLEEEALLAIQEMLRKDYPLCKRVSLKIHPEYLSAQRLMEKAGFKKTDEYDSGEIIFSSKPRARKKEKLSRD